MSDEDKIEFLGGQVLALMHFMTALISTHPDLAALKMRYEKANLVGLAKVEGSSISDAYLDGMHEVHK